MTQKQVVLDGASRRVRRSVQNSRPKPNGQIGASGPRSRHTEEALTVGYARVSTGMQDVGLQVEALKAAGCRHVFVDVMSGSKDTRPELAACLAYLRAGDSLVVWRLDRLGRSLRHLLATVAQLQERSIAFRSLHEALDTGTANGRLLFHIMASISEFERSLLQERVIAGLAHARSQGRTGGRPRALTGDRLEVARSLFANGRTVTEVSTALKVSRATVYRWLETARIT